MSTINDFDDERKWARFDEWEAAEAAKQQARPVTNLFLQKRVLTQGKHLSNEAMRLYMALLTFRNNGTGRCYPARETLIERSGLSERKYRAGLAELIHFNWIVRERHMNKSNDYTVGYVTRSHSDGTLLEDQTCPTKAEALAYKRSLSRRRKLKQPYVGGESKFVPTWMNDPADGHEAPLLSCDPEDWPDQVGDEEFADIPF